MLTRALTDSRGIFITFLVCLIVAGCSKKESDESKDVSERGTIELSPQEFKSKLASEPDAILIDVRKPEELEEGMIEGAINIDFTDSTFAKRIEMLDKTKPYFVYCKSGKRSAGAVEGMEKLGFENIYILQGGYTTWQGEGLETVKPNQP